MLGLYIVDTHQAGLRQQMQFKQATYRLRARRKVVCHCFGKPGIEHGLNGQVLLGLLLVLPNDLGLRQPYLLRDSLLLACPVAHRAVIVSDGRLQ